MLRRILLDQAGLKIRKFVLSGPRHSPAPLGHPTDHLPRSIQHHLPFEPLMDARIVMDRRQTPGTQVRTRQGEVLGKGRLGTGHAARQDPSSVGREERV
jgi:hypothetical protein